MDKKIREGVSIQELENFGKKYHFEILFVLYFLLATLLNFLWKGFGTTWSIFLTGIGGILGSWFSKKIEKAAQSAFQFINKQEKITRLILAIAGALISFFLPPVIFFLTGLMGGAGINRISHLFEKSSKEQTEEGVD